jgi:hypothetical protein
MDGWMDGWRAMHVWMDGCTDEVTALKNVGYFRK